MANAQGAIDARAHLATGRTRELRSEVVRPFEKPGTTALLDFALDPEQTVAVLALSEAARNKLFHGNARRVCKL